MICIEVWQPGFDGLRVVGDDRFAFPPGMFHRFQVLVCRLLHMQERTLERISETGARRLVIDVTGVPIVDTLVAQGLISIVQMARLLGATVTLVGIRPEVAQTLVQLGVQIGDVQTFRDLQAALAQPSPIRQSAG